jgi:hypothetical protein
MKRALKVMGVVLATAAGVLWLATGANRGWTRTSVAVRTVDEVTGIEGISYRKQFVPGLDFLGSALLGAGLLAGASLFFHNSTNKQTK